MFRKQRVRHLPWLLVWFLILAVGIVSCGCAFSLPPEDGSKESGDVTEPLAPVDPPLTGSDEAQTADEQSAIRIEPRTATVSVLCAGDNIIYMGQIREAQKAAKNGKAYDFTPMYENVRDLIASYDVAFVNQETIMAGEGYALSAYPQFNSPVEVADALEEVGFDVVNIATNHMLDKGSAALENTIRAMSERSFLLVGGYEDEEDLLTLRMIERDGVKIAFLGFTYGTNIKATATSPYIPVFDREAITSAVTAARQACDVLVVSMHWGTEYRQTPNDTQKEYAALLAELGTDVIVGHHPHCLQPIEWLDGKDGHRTLCFWSLGNFTSQTDEVVSLPGGFGTFDILYNESTGITVDHVKFIPTVMDYRSSFNVNRVYLLENYSDDLCRGHGIVSYFHKSLSVGQLRTVLLKAISPEYLPKEFVS